MALPTPPIGPGNPIPNNPFYYPTTNRLEGGDQGLVIIGAGLTITPEGVLNATGTGGTAVTTLTAGPGVFVSQPDGNVTLANTGVISLTPGPGISISGTAGNLTITNTAPASGPTGTVTSVATGAGLVGGPITTSGTIELATVSTVAPGTYTNATITVDTYGRITYAAPGTSGGGSITATAPLAVTSTFPQNISISFASTASAGVVQLNTSTASTSTTQAATPSAVKAAYDLGFTAAANAATALSAATGAASAASSAQTTANNAQLAATAAQTAANAAQTTANTALANAGAAQVTANAAIPCASFTVKGQLLAATGPSTFTALPAGTNGQVLIACSSCTSGLTWISQPVAAGTVTSVGTGPGLLGGPITTTGTITLAPTGVTPNTYTYANVSVDAYGRITSAGCGVPPIPCSAITGKGVVLTGTAANAPTALPAGTNGYVLTACSACATGLTWALAATSGIPTSAITGKGALITGTAANTVSTLPVGSNGFVLTADSACASGLKWSASASPTVPATPTTEGVIYGYADSATNFATALGYDALNVTVTGPGNVAIGTSAGCSLSSGQLNTYVGSGAGCANTTGCNNIALGAQALFAHVSGDCNIAIGNLAGLSLTSESGNVILGPFQAEAGCDNNVYIADGTGTLRVRLNENGALALSGSGYGTSGQVLTSGGPTTTPTWTTVASSGGTVTSITAGTGLSGGTITTTGTINLANTTVTAGSYTNASITVDVQGRLTAASSGLAPLTALTGTSPIAVTAGTTPVVSIASSSTTAPGAVQLYDNVDSTSTTLALTAAQGKNLQDQITALSVAGTVELAGTVDASAGGLVLSVTSVGTTDGYVVGSPLPAATVTTNNTYVIVTTPGTMTPPGGSPTAATRGDWFLVSETSPGVYAWTFLNVGFDVSYATTASSGVVCLSTNALAQAGVDTLTALTPAAAASAYIPKTCVTAKGTLITGTAASTPAALTVGTDGQALIACAACASGLTWATPAVPATPTVSGTVLGCTLAASTAIGCNALLSNTGAGNSALGVNALSSGATGNNNTAIGACALCSNTTGVNNTAIGSKALIDTTTGNFNVAIGRDAMVANTTGCCNTVIGYRGACALTTGSFNVAIGTSVQVASATGSCQLAIGFSEICNWLTGNSTKAIQPGAGIIDCAGSCGTASQVLMSNGSNAICWGTIGAATPTVAGTVRGCTDTSNAALGCNAFLTGGGANNVAIGLDSQKVSTANDNVSAGCATLKANTLGFQNTAIGHIAMCSLTGASANQNVAVGSSALCAFTSGLSNDAVGALAMQKFQTGSYNVAVGGYSLFCYVTGNDSTAIGHRALNAATGCCNTSLGTYSGANITTGAGNVAIGPFTEVANPAGNNQLSIGYAAGQNWLTGTSTKAIKPGAGIIDCANTCGVLGQVLMSTGANSVCWGYGNPYPAWTSAGTIQSVGWNSQGGVAVVPGTVSRNNVSYRQVGIKEWQVVYTFTATGNFVNSGSGGYLFTLPNGLQFDTSLAWQPAFTGNGASHAYRQYFLPGASSLQVAFTNGSNGSQFGTGIVVFDATRFRIFATDVGNGAPQPMANNYWGGLNISTFSLSFQFTSL